MNPKGSLARNTLYSAISSASNVFLIVLVILAARILGDTAFGEFSFALALASIFEMLMDLGLNTLSARNVSRDRGLAKIYLPNVLGWKLVLAVGAAGLFILTVKLMHQPRTAEVAAYILGASVVLRSYKSTSFAYFQAFERFDLILITTYIERLSGLIFGSIALLVTRSLIGFASVFLLIRIPDVLITYWFMHKAVARVSLRLDPAVIRKLQSAAVPFAFSSMVLVVYMYLGTVVLSLMRPPREVGWFNAGYKVYEGLTMFPFLICAVLLPRLSHLFAASREKHADLCLRALKYAAAASIPILIAVGLAAPVIVRVLYGDSFSPAVPALRILLIAAAFMFANWILNTVLISGDMEKRALLIWTLGLIVSAGGNLILVSRLGMIGAACALVVAEVSVFAMMAFSVRGRLIARKPE